jgi:hypothetical protein
MWPRFSKRMNWYSKHAQAPESWVCGGPQLGPWLGFAYYIDIYMYNVHIDIVSRPMLARTLTLTLMITGEPGVCGYAVLDWRRWMSTFLSVIAYLEKGPLWVNLNHLHVWGNSSSWLEGSVQTLDHVLLQRFWFCLSLHFWGLDFIFRVRQIYKTDIFKAFPAGLGYFSRRQQSTGLFLICGVVKTNPWFAWLFSQMSDNSVVLLSVYLIPEESVLLARDRWWSLILHSFHLVHLFSMTTIQWT